jgi:predicted transposase YdaD
MARMGMEQSERARVKLECLRLLTSLRLDRARQRLISGFVDTYLRLDAAEALQFNHQADTLLEHVEKEKIMELTTSWKEEGRAEGKAEGKVEGKAEGKVEGIAEGKAEGRLEGEMRVVLRQLERRCGVLPPPLLERVRGLSLERLEDLAEALLEFNGAADLERWLN